MHLGWTSLRKNVEKRLLPFSPLALSAITGCALLGFGGGGDDLVHTQTYRVNAPKQWTAIEHGESDHAYRLPSGDIATPDQLV